MGGNTNVNFQSSMPLPWVRPCLVRGYVSPLATPILSRSNFLKGTHQYVPKAMSDMRRLGRSETSLYCSNVQKCTHISTLPRHLLFTCRGRTNIRLSQQLFWRTLYLAKSIQYLPSNPDSSIFIEIMRVQSLFFNKSVAKRRGTGYS